MNQLLINLSDITKYKEISINIDVKGKVYPAIREAQDFDLRPVIGDELYLSIIANEPTGYGIYAPLMDGCNYTYDGRQYQHDGLKAVLAYYSYARMLPGLNSNNTPYGQHVKLNEWGQPVADKQLNHDIAQAISIAQVMQGRVIDYLNRNSTTFTLWKCNVVPTKTGSIRITAVGGKNKVGSSKRCRFCGRYSCNC